MDKYCITLKAELECVRFKDGQHKVEFSTSDGALWHLPLRDFVRAQPLMRWKTPKRLLRAVRKMHIGLLELRAQRAASTMSVGGCCHG